MKANKTFEQEIINEIKGVKGCQFIHLGYVSEPSLNKAQKLAISVMGGFEEIVPIVKVSRGQFQVNYSYENAVNNRAEKECGAPVGFVAQSLPWGKWVDGQVNKLIEHKGEIYLRFYGLKNGKVENEYYVGDKPATNEQVKLIKQFTERGGIFTQANAGLTENQVIARNVKVSNILSLSVDGKVYEIDERVAA
jgi:hypothetical protein